MEARKLTIEQKENIQGVFFDEVTFFNCIQDINDNWFIFLSTTDISNLQNSQWQWVIDIPTSHFEPKPVDPPA
tara:strand:+ start:1947 stop:2165 length:219 start_codon:yes stop_codon:yes gene_type:complete